MIPNKDYMRAAVITVNPSGVLVVGVVFLPTLSSYGAINPISKSNLSTEHQKVP
jgi:hypothetical protein